MNDKPKELKGSVLKFEDAVRFTPAFETRFNHSHKVDRMIDFYTQPFTTEMIEKYFKGWVFAEISPFVTITYNKNGDKIIFNNDLMEFMRKDPIGSRTVRKSFIVSFSDFIDTCLNSGIKLEWKE